MKFFETIKIENGMAHNLKYHQNRFEKTYFENFGILPKVKIIDFLKSFDVLKRAKFVYDFERFEISFFDYFPKKIEKIKIVEIENFNYQQKALDRSFFDNLIGSSPEFDEIFMFRSGFLTDCTIANIAIYENNKWITPSEYLLFGTTLERYLDSGFLAVEQIDVERLKKAEKIALMNAMIDFKIYEKLEFL